MIVLNDNHKNHIYMVSLPYEFVYAVLKNLNLSHQNHKYYIHTVSLRCANVNVVSLDFFPWCGSDIDSKRMCSPRFAEALIRNYYNDLITLHEKHSTDNSYKQLSLKIINIFHQYELLPEKVCIVSLVYYTSIGCNRINNVPPN